MHRRNFDKEGKPTFAHHNRSANPCGQCGKGGGASNINGRFLCSDCLNDNMVAPRPPAREGWIRHGDLWRAKSLEEPTVKQERSFMRKWGPTLLMITAGAILLGVGITLPALGFLGFPLYGWGSVLTGLGIGTLTLIDFVDRKWINFSFKHHLLHPNPKGHHGPGRAIETSLTLLAFAAGAALLACALGATSTHAVQAGFATGALGAASLVTYGYATQSWKYILGKPNIVVSPTAASVNGQEANLGADFGPDTPGTTTSGIQEAANNVGPNGGTVFLRNGNFSITGLTTQSLNAHQNSAIILPSGVRIVGSGVGATLITMPPIPAGKTNGWAVAFSNASIATGNTQIETSDLSIILPSPLTSATGMLAWDDAVELDGGYQCNVERLYVENGGVAFYPNTANVNTSTALSAGNNYENILRDSRFFQCTGSITLFQGTRCTIERCTVDTNWDDAILVGSAGQKHVIRDNIINGAPVVAGKGGTTAGIFLENDGGVGAGQASLAMSEIVLSGNILYGRAGFNSGNQDGITVLGARDVTISECICDGNHGSGLDVGESYEITVAGCTSKLNGASGINIYQDLAAAVSGFDIVGCHSYYNGTVGANPFGLRVNAGAGTIEGVRIIGGTYFDDRSASATQTWAFALSNATGAVLSHVFISGADLSNSPNIFDNSGSPSFLIKDCAGYNPQGFAVTTPAFPATATNVQNTNPYPVRIYLLTAGAGTAFQITDPSGTAQLITVGLTAGMEFTLDPGAQILFDYTTAPTWKWYGI